MSLPVPAEYADTVQNPSTAFFDPELQAATAASDAMGLPVAYSGNFAVAFRMRGGSGTYAVRCFTRDVSDVQRRYDAISRFFASSFDAALCSFEYQTRGITVRGMPLPIVKMEWADGERLDKWLAANHDDVRGLRRVAEGIAHIAERLERRDAAHGDLQHGNLMITSGFVRLIDYDGMFVPALAGLDSPVLGHRNYQHPGRTAAQFDARMDRFSILVLFVGLTALAADKTRYLRYGCDERVLFERADFENPDESDLFHELSRDSMVGGWALALAEACRRPAWACPSLSEVLDGSYLAMTGPVTLARKTRVAPPRPQPAPPPSQARAQAQPQPQWQTPPPAPPTQQRPYSAMPPPYAPYVVAPPPQRSHGRALVIGSIVALVLAVSWHPWSHRDTYTHPYRNFHYTPPQQAHGVPQRSSQTQPRAMPAVNVVQRASTPRPATTAPPKRPAASLAAKRAAPAAVDEFAVQAQKRTGAAASPMPSRAGSVASELEDVAQRGRAPASSASGANETDAVQQRPARTCTTPDTDAGPASLMRPDVPDSLNGRSAVAEIRVSLDASGRVLAAGVMRSTGNSDADAAALAAARASTFHPARKNCEPVGGEYSVEFAFN